MDEPLSPEQVEALRQGLTRLIPEPQEQPAEREIGVGDVVIFYAGAPAPVYSSPRPAIVTCVRDPRFLSLCIFTEEGLHFKRGVPFGPGRAHCWGWKA